MLRGYCRPHFRLFFGEDPEVEAARTAQQQEDTPAVSRPRKEMRLVTVPRNAGRLGMQLDGDWRVTGVDPNGLADRTGELLPGDQLVGVNGFEVVKTERVADVLQKLPPSSALTIAAVRLLSVQDPDQAAELVVEADGAALSALPRHVVMKR